MMQDIFFYSHYAIAVLIAIYAIAAFIMDARLAKTGIDSPGYLKLNQSFFMMHKVTLYLGLVTFLIGGKMGTIFFMTGSVWIYLKLFLFVVYFGLMSALGSKAFKLRKQAADSSDQRTEILESAAKKMKLFKYSQAIIVVLLYLIAYIKPFGYL
ncbi:MAG: hypothetical protein AB7T22_15825 [Calditrichaceae bacterium]